MDVTGDGSKVRCCNEQHCTGAWNVRSMNQGKLEAVKPDGKSGRQHIRNQQTKWTAMDEFNSDDDYIYYCGQESLRKME